MKVIYIAGPYRSDTEWGVFQNIRRAELRALQVWNWGGVALCPHKNTEMFGGAYNLPDDVWLKGDLELIKRCDALWLSYDWEKSSGTTAEKEFAESIGLPVFIKAEDVREYLWRNEDDTKA